MPSLNGGRSGIDLPVRPGRSILDIHVGWVRCKRIPRIQPNCWSERQPGDYAGVCVAFKRERTRRQDGMPDVLQLDARAAGMGVDETQAIMQIIRDASELLGCPMMSHVGTFETCRPLR